MLRVVDSWYERGMTAPRYVLLDRDGTLIVEREYLASPDGVELLPQVGAGLRALQEGGWRLAVVTNQSGVGRGFFTLDDVRQVHERLAALLAAEGVSLAGWYVCPHDPADDCRCRKPRPGLIVEAARQWGFDPREAVVVGDKRSDLELAENVGAQGILVRTGYGRRTETAGLPGGTIVVDDLSAAARVILAD